MARAIKKYKNGLSIRFLKVSKKYYITFGVSHVKINKNYHEGFKSFEEAEEFLLSLIPVHNTNYEWIKNE